MKFIRKKISCHFLKGKESYISKKASNKKKLVRKSILVMSLCLFILISVFSGCVNKNNLPIEELPDITKVSKDIITTTFSYDKEIDFSLYDEINFSQLLPITGEICKQTETDAKIIKISSDEFNYFIKTLKNNGWELLDNTYTNVEGTIHRHNAYIFLKDNNELEINNYTTTDKENIHSHKNYVTLKITKGSKYSYYKGRTSKDNAKKLIQSILETYKSQHSFYGETVYKLIEANNDQLYEKTAIQIFKTYTNERYIGEFLVCKNSVLEPSTPLCKSVIADIDKDGVYELLDIRDIWSGFPRCSFVAYKYGIPTNSNEKKLYKAYSGSIYPYAMRYDLIKVSKNEVHLYGYATLDKEEDHYDYGALKIEGERLYTDITNSLPDHY